ncbi:MAG: MarR family transcriptional regulator [Acidimicrobiaceae bacterium]|nr:MarR family transcriptional regulator [Acidimicrobiaceae bacterium]
MSERVGVLSTRTQSLGGTGARSRRTERRDPDGVTGVADSVIDLLRTVRRSKARLLAAAGNDVESATLLLLRTVAGEGPMRASALAASVQSDVSTVSRQVAALVGRGLLERRADQLDGRASLLAVTRAGRAVIAEHEQGRRRFFQEVLADWNADELTQFAGFLERFTSSYDRTHRAWMRDRARAASPDLPNARGGTPSGPEGGRSL